jgi:hypothetical protein
MAQDRVQRRAVVTTVIIFFDSIKGGEFLYQMNDYYLLKEDSASWSYSRN